MKMATSIRRLRAGKGGRCSERFTGPPSFPVGRRAEGSPGVRVEGDALSRRPGACRTRAFTPAALLGARRRPAARPRVPLRSTGGAKAVAPAPLCDGDAHNVPAAPPSHRPRCVRVPPQGFGCSTEAHLRTPVHDGRRAAFADVVVRRRCERESESRVCAPTAGVGQCETSIPMPFDGHTPAGHDVLAHDGGRRSAFARVVPRMRRAFARLHPGAGRRHWIRMLPLTKLAGRPCPTRQTTPATCGRSADLVTKASGADVAATPDAVERAALRHDRVSPQRPGCPAGARSGAEVSANRDLCRNQKARNYILNIIANILKISS